MDGWRDDLGRKGDVGKRILNRGSGYVSLLMISVDKV